MKQRPRIYYTEAQKAMMWKRWREGESLAPIARLFDRQHSSIERIIRENGGIRLPERRRAACALTLEEREEISRCIVAGDSLRSRPCTVDYQSRNQTQWRPTPLPGESR